MWIFIVGEKVNERKKTEHALILKGLERFHSIHPSGDRSVYLEKNWQTYNYYERKWREIILRLQE